MPPLLEPIAVSAGLVALAEIGDKTQLLAILLAAKFRKPAPIILGILCATLLNHVLAAALGAFAAQWLGGPVFRIAVGAGFLIMAGWALIPDKPEEGAAARKRDGVFLTTLIAFFLVEIGDKTQVATTLLAARFQDVLLVTLGSTAGMMLANIPAVMLGEAATRILPLRLVRLAAALLFALLGVFMVLSALGWLGI